MKYHFIINGKSGKDNKSLLEKKIREACFKREINYDITYTKGPGDAKRIAAEFPDEESVIFSVGGDGNLNDTLNGIVGSEKKILGVFPAGSGNDFVRTLKQLDDGIHSIDIGSINNRYFINVACVGLDADVADNVSITREKKWIPTSQRFNASFVYTYFKYFPKKVKIRMGENEAEGYITILAICNAQYYGSGYRIAPHALLDDGLFDIYLVKRMPKISILPMLASLARGKHEKYSAIKRYQESEIHVESDEKLSFNVDGELVRGNSFDLKLHKAAIRIFNDKEFVNEVLK